jgi:hypothetical protein
VQQQIPCGDDNKKGESNGKAADNKKGESNDKAAIRKWWFS